MNGRVEQMRQELISTGVNPEIVNTMSEKQLEAACRERNIQIQSGLNNNANWGNVEDGFHRETAEVHKKEYELRPMTDEEKSQLRQTGVAPLAGKGGGIAKALIGLLGVGSLLKACHSAGDMEPKFEVYINIITNGHGDTILDDARIGQLKDKIKSDRLEKNQTDNVENEKIVKELYESAIASIDPVKYPEIKEAVVEHRNNFVANMESLRLGSPEDMITLTSEYLDGVKQILAIAEEDELKSANSGQSPDSGLQGDILKAKLNELNNRHLEKMKQAIEVINKSIESEFQEYVKALDEATCALTEKQEKIVAEKKIVLKEIERDPENLYREKQEKIIAEKNRELERLEQERENLYREIGMEPL